ncbi:MAG: flagellar hook-basal body complex protein FliE [Planctomycetota bacterium]
MNAIDPIQGLFADRSKATTGAGAAAQVDTARLLARTDSESGTSPFSSVLENAVNSIVDQQRVADRAVLDLASGRRDDIASIMIEVHKSGLAFTFALEVRNKIMDAYHEISRMSV